MRRLLSLLVLAPAAALLLAGCATPLPPSGDWQAQLLPGKRATKYASTEKDGRTAWRAESVASASLWRKRLKADTPAVTEVSFSWWVQDLVPGASVAKAELEDSPARLIFGFAGDNSSLPLRTRMQFELVETLTGEAPPFATLMYVWDSALPVGTVVINPRSDRIRKIVVDSGPQQLRRWRDHRRDLAADFKLAFGEAPGRLTLVAVMSDSDNTGSKSTTWFGAVQVH